MTANDTNNFEKFIMMNNTKIVYATQSTLNNKLSITIQYIDIDCKSLSFLYSQITDTDLVIHQEIIPTKLNTVTITLKIQMEYNIVIKNIIKNIKIPTSHINKEVLLNLSDNIFIKKLAVLDQLVTSNVNNLENDITLITTYSDPKNFNNITQDVLTEYNNVFER